MSGTRARRPAGAPAAKPSAKPGGARPARGKPASRPAPRHAGPAGAAPRASWRRWLAVGVIVAAILVILPVVGAMFGDVWALLIGTLVGGFVLGRATLRR